MSDRSRSHATVPPRAFSERRGETPTKLFRRRFNRASNELTAIPSRALSRARLLSIAVSEFTFGQLSSSY
jgi:hypothetical protein